MAIIVEFTLDSESFPFGRATSGDPDVRAQLERVIPLREGRIPFIWAASAEREFDEFERHLRNSDIVKDVEALTRIGDSVLYYTEWYTDRETFLNGLGEAGGTIMEAHGDSTWSFTVRFRDHTQLTRFHQFYQDEGFPVYIERVTTLDDEPGTEYGFGLTPAQRDTLIMAVEEGYFDIPRRTSLEELAEEVGISSQAVSERIRRGTETVLRKALVGLVAADFESPDDE
ncbi:helix-turn-helix domain-containing protein [Halorussus sp. AFM4]|uniref:helix-turn-helix domain-containing protein n=1 Tax=Halorussus sp. AFM4 TaxID=3421651 RepID=UPI003EBF16A2